MKLHARYGYGCSTELKRHPSEEKQSLLYSQLAQVLLLVWVPLLPV